MGNNQKEGARCISHNREAVVMLTSQVVTTPSKVYMTRSWEGMESRKTTVAMPCSWKRRFVTDSSVRCLVFSQFNYLSPLVPPLESLRGGPENLSSNKLLAFLDKHPCFNRFHGWLALLRGHAYEVSAKLHSSRDLHCGRVLYGRNHHSYV